MTARDQRNKTPLIDDTGRVWQVDVLVADGFVLMELAGLVDTLRVANRINPAPLFRWTYRSAKGGQIESRCRAFVHSEPFVARPSADYVFVIGNSDPDNPALSLGPVIESYTYRDAQVFLLAEAASRYISENSGKSQGHATHWENQAFLRERAGQFDASYTIASQDGPVVTCAGMGATVDVVLALIGRHMSSAAKMVVADVLLHERIRDYGSMQPFSGIKSTTTGDRELDDCIEIMQANVEEPIPINELVAVLGISNRSLERKFQTFLATTPNTYYRELRLNKANNLLFNTTMTVAEIGLACGFASGFSTLYKKFYGITPMALRKKRRGGKG